MGYAIKLEAEFYLGQPVYVKTDPDQQMCIVLAYRITPKEIMYECSKGMMTNMFSYVELSPEKNVGQYG